MTEDQFEEMIANAKRGDEAAAARIWDLYAERLLKYARRKLEGMPRRAMDEEDVANSALNSFFVRLQAGGLDPKDPDELWKLLATFTVRKAIRQRRRHFAAKRGGGHVLGESALSTPMRDGGISFGIGEWVDPKAADEMIGQLMDTCESRLADLDIELRRVALLKLEGYSNEEIADCLDCASRTVERRLARIREKWNDESRDADASP